MTYRTENECDPEHGVWVPVAAGGGWRGVFLATLLLTGYLSALHISLSLGWGPGESQPSHHSLRPCAGLLFHLRASSCLHRAVAEEPATTPVPACVWSGHQLGFPPLQHGGENRVSWRITQGWCGPLWQGRQLTGCWCQYYLSSSGLCWSTPSYPGFYWAYGSPPFFFFTSMISLEA